MSDINSLEFQIKLYCRVLGIRYEDIRNCTVDKKIEVIESINTKGYIIKGQTKKALTNLLMKEKNEEEKFNEENKELEDILKKASYKTLRDRDR